MKDGSKSSLRIKILTFDGAFKVFEKKEDLRSTINKDDSLSTTISQQNLNYARINVPLTKTYIMWC